MERINPPRLTLSTHQIRISYGDALAMDELALFYGFLPATTQGGRLCAVHREDQGGLLHGLGSENKASTRREVDVTQGAPVVKQQHDVDGICNSVGSPYLVAREAGRIIDLVEAATPMGAKEGMPARLTEACTRLLEAERRRLERFLNDL